MGHIRQHKDIFAKPREVEKENKTNIKSREITEISWVKKITECGEKNVDWEFLIWFKIMILLFFIKIEANQIILISMWEDLSSFVFLNIGSIS